MCMLIIKTRFGAGRGRLLEGLQRLLYRGNGTLQWHLSHAKMVHRCVATWRARFHDMYSHLIEWITIHSQRFERPNRSSGVGVNMPTTNGSYAVEH